MGKSYIGTITPYAASCNMCITAPLDDRLVVDNYEDLFDSIEFPYVGMVVNVKATSSLYVLVCTKNEGGNLKPDVWKEIKSVENYVVETIDKLTSVYSPYVGMTVYVKETQSLWTLIDENNIQDNWKEIKSGGAYFVEKISDLSNTDLRPYIGMFVHVHENPMSVYMYNGDNIWKEFRSIDNYVVETKTDLNNIESPYVGMFVHVKSEPHSMWLYSKSDTDDSFGWKEFKDYTTTLGDVDLSNIQNQIDKLKGEIENLKSPNLHVDVYNPTGFKMDNILRFTYDKSIKKSDTYTFDNVNHKLTFTTPEQDKTE